MSWFETTRGLAVLTALVTVAAGAFAFWVGYGIGSAPPQQIIVHLDAPLIQPAPK